MHGNAPELMIALGVAAAIGLYAGKAVYLARFPSQIGHMVLGVVIGVSGFNLLDEPALESLAFVVQVALGFVAFTVGAELSIASLKRQARGVIPITLGESLGAFLVVLAGVYVVTRDLPLSLIFAAIAPTTAPAGTVAVIREYRAKGHLTKTLYAVAGFDDALGIIIYAFAATAALSLLAKQAGVAGGNLFGMLGGAVSEIAISLLIGSIVGLAFTVLANKLRNSGEIFVFIFGTVVACVGLSLRFHASFILSNMVVGFILANTRREETVRRLLAPVGQFMPLVFIVFFCLAGAQLDVRVLPAIGLASVTYMICRSAGKITGSFLGAVIGKAEKKVKNYVGLGILSQAGVAIGLALVARQQLGALGSEHALHIGTALITSVAATSIIFQVIGPILTKIALQKAGEIGRDDTGDSA